MVRLSPVTTHGVPEKTLLHPWTVEDDIIFLHLQGPSSLATDQIPLEGVSNRQQLTAAVVRERY